MENSGKILKMILPVITGRKRIKEQGIGESINKLTETDKK